MTKEISVDLAIIGAGTAGISAFKEASRVTQNIVLIDQGPLGTTCARVGCMPSKVFIQAANYFYDRHYFAVRGIEGADKVKLNIPHLLNYVRKMRDDFVSGTVEYLDSIGDKFIKGHAEILGPDLIQVNNQKIIAKKIIIATGSHSLVPDEWRDFSVLTSENFFEQKDFSSKMVVLGAGAIGLELGQALKRIGIDVALFHSHKTLTHLTDPEVNNYAIKTLEQEYPLYLDQKAQLEKNNDDIIVKSKDKTVKTKQVLAALGRVPNLSIIDFNKLGIKTNEKGMPLFDETTMQIQDSTIFLAGDVTKERQLLHEAADEGRIAGYNAVRSPHCFHRRTPLSIIFSDPNIAMIGQSYKDSLKQECIMGEARFDHQGRAKIMSKNKGILRVYAEPKHGTLLGAELFAPAGEHIAHLLAWAIQKEMTVLDILQMPYYHPVIEEGMRTALRELAKQLSKPKSSELAMCDSQAMPTLS